MLGRSRRRRQAIQGAECPQPGQADREREDRGGVGRLSQREEETLRVAVRADVHKTAPEHLLDPGAWQGCRGRLSGGMESVWIGTHGKPAEAFGLFAGPLGLSGPRGLPSGRGHRRPCSRVRWIGSLVVWECASNAGRIPWVQEQRRTQHLCGIGSRPLPSP